MKEIYIYSGKVFVEHVVQNYIDTLFWVMRWDQSPSMFSLLSTCWPTYWLPSFGLSHWFESPLTRSNSDSPLSLFVVGLLCVLDQWEKWSLSLFLPSNSFLEMFSSDQEVWHHTFVVEMTYIVLSQNGRSWQLLLFGCILRAVLREISTLSLYAWFSLSCTHI